MLLKIPAVLTPHEVSHCRNPADSLHRVEPITRGSRWAAFFWTQSMAKNDGDRELLYRFDRSITLTRAELGDRHPAVLGLTATHHNLLRKWAVV